jgi:hypothetical protein
MMRHQVGEVAPELDYMRADAACGGTTSSRKYSTIRDLQEEVPDHHAW